MKLSQIKKLLQTETVIETGDNPDFKTACGSDLLDHVSTAKSPQQMFSPLSKTYYADQTNIEPEKIYTVSVMLCTVKKFEKEREEMNDSGYQDTDAVLTTRELARMIKEIGLNFTELEEEEFDEMMGKFTGAGTIFGSTGGVTEAAIDKSKFIRKSHENPMVKKLYDEYLEKPLSEKFHKPLHTLYVKRAKN